VAAIETEGLGKIYRSRGNEVRALEGVDLEVQEGTILGLLGPNGAGKTTTVRILATLLHADEGRATVAGIDVARDPQAVRKVIGLSGQYAAVDENLTGRENLWMFGRLYRLSSGTLGGVPTSSSGSSGSRTPPTAWPRRTPAGCAAGSISRALWSGGPSCSSSTSRPPGSTRAGGSGCGT